LPPEASQERGAAEVAAPEAPPAAAEALQAAPPAIQEPASSVASDVGVNSQPAAAPPDGAPASAATTPSSTSSGKTVVIVNVRPPQARIYYRGKEAGRAPLRVELEPGQRRSFEVGYPGFMTRKIMVDGSKPEILVGLRAASPYATRSTPPAPEN
jgi:hypothetical protein